MSYRREATWVLSLLLAAGSVAIAWGPTKFTPSSADDINGPIGPQGVENFINWETPQIHPVDMTPDGNFLLVLNTADNRLQVFDLTGSAPQLAFTVPVGLDPVSVRPRSNTDAWVVNQLSAAVTLVHPSTRHGHHQAVTTSTSARYRRAGSRGLRRIVNPAAGFLRPSMLIELQIGMGCELR